MLLVEVRGSLKFAREGDDAVFSKRRTNNLQSDGKPVHRSAGHRDGRQSAKITCLHQTGHQALLLRVLRGCVIERPISPIGQIQTGWSNQQIHISEELSESIWIWVRTRMAFR